MATVVETMPCPRCGAETYSKPDEREVMVYCSETDMPVLTCNAVPRWQQEAMEEANRANAEWAENRGEKAPKEDEAVAPPGYAAEGGEESKSSTESK